MGKIALIVVDVQNDFCEGGALAVDGGNAVADAIAEYMKKTIDTYDYIFFTQDWHDADNNNGGHFDEWPVHCVADTEGARLHPVLDAIKFNPRDFAPYEKLNHDHFFLKGQGTHGYSGFEGKNREGFGLDAFLKAKDVSNVDIAGIAGDYCVKATALDAVKNGYEVLVLRNMVVSVGGRDATLRSIAEVYDAERLRDGQ